MDTKELLKKRKLLKKKKPEFIRQDAHKKKKVGWKWRKPKGSDSKMRVNRKGYRRTVKKGWGSPKAVRYADQEGLLPVTIRNTKDLQKLDPAKNAIIISSNTGTKKKMEVIEQAASRNIRILNYKDPEKHLEELKKMQEQKKEEKKKLKKERDKKREETKKEAEKKKAKEEKEKKEKEKTEEKTEEEKKLEEKKERDKTLISTQ